jgi:transcription initiation factor TFIID subunit 5
MSGALPGPGPIRQMSVGNGPPSAGLPPHNGGGMQSQQNSIPPAAGGQSQQQNLNQIVSERLSTFSFTSPALSVPPSERQKLPL